MSFAGLRSDKDRINLIAFLRTQCRCARRHSGARAQSRAKSLPNPPRPRRPAPRIAQGRCARPQRLAADGTGRA